MNLDTLRAQMADIQTKLVDAGYSVTVLNHEMETSEPSLEVETLRVEYPLGKTNVVYHIVSAEAFFDNALEYTRKTSMDLRIYVGNNMVSEVRGSQVYLLIVGDDSFVRDPARESMISQIELDDATVRKYVCAASEVLDWVASPFTTWATPAGASTPRFYVLPDVPDPWGPALPETPVNLEFSAPTAEEVCAVLASHPRAAQIKAVTTALIRRSLGTNTQLIWRDDDYPDIARNRSSLPFDFQSRNEQRLFFVAFFLARAHADEAQGLYVGLRAIMEGWDIVRRFAVTDALRDFSLATGASIRLTVHNRSLLPFFDVRIRQVLYGYVGYNKA